MLTPDNQAKDYYPAPGEYDVAATTSMTRATPHYPLVKGVPTKIFGSQPQRPTSNESTSPVRARSSLGPGSYNVEKKLGSDLPGARIDYHASYQKIAIDLVEGRKEMGELFHGMVVLSKESNGVFSQNDDTDGDNGAYSIPSATIKPRDETANRFQTPAPDPYTWMLGPGSYDDGTMAFGAALIAPSTKHDRQGRTQKELNDEKRTRAKWGTTPNIATVERMVAAQSQSLVSADRLPSEQLVVGYDSSAKHKDFNKIYTDVAKKMEIKNVQRVKERCGESGWKKELERMKAKARRRGGGESYILFFFYFFPSKKDELTIFIFFIFVFSLFLSSLSKVVPCEKK